MKLLNIKILNFLIFTAFALFMFFIFRTYIIEKQHDGVDINVTNTQQYIEQTIDFVINEKKQHYINSSKIIFSDVQVTNALKSKNRQNFYNQIKPYYDRLKKRDNNFWGLHIILPDNMSFIRVHKPEVADKLIKKGKKPLIDKVNETHEQVTSFNAGKFGYFLRVVTPIFSPTKEYLGVAEFSINVDSLTQHIKSKFGYEALLLVNNIHNKKFLNQLAKTKNNLTIFKSTNESFFNHYNLDSDDKHYDYVNHIHIDYENKSFSTVLIKLSDTADLIVAFDVTNIIDEHKKFKNNVTSIILIVILVFLVISIVATKFYIINKQQIEIELQRSHDILSENVIYSYTDLNGVITEVSDAFCRISGYTRKEIIGSTHNILHHPDTTNILYDDLWTTIKENRIWHGEHKNLKPNGDFYWVDATISPRFDSHQNKIGYMAIQQDISNKKLIEKNSITDSLCSIYNRRHFDDVLPKVINIAKRKNEKICLIIMDVDFFKQYNDIYGHQMGDDVLRKIASCLKHSLHRADDYCFRLGGEEFGVIFKTENKETSVNYANVIKNNIENLKIIHKGSNVSEYITASFGLICRHANDIHNADDLFREADTLLYKSKHSGRNIVQSNIEIY